jgi:hypothetical protein
LLRCQIVIGVAELGVMFILQDIKLEGVKEEIASFLSGVYRI